MPWFPHEARAATVLAVTDTALVLESHPIQAALAMTLETVGTVVVATQEAAVAVEDGAAVEETWVGGGVGVKAPIGTKEEVGQAGIMGVVILLEGAAVVGTLSPLPGMVGAKPVGVGTMHSLVGPLEGLYGRKALEHQTPGVEAGIVSLGEVAVVGAIKVEPQATLREALVLGIAQEGITQEGGIPCRQVVGGIMLQLGGEVGRKVADITRVAVGTETGFRPVDSKARKEIATVGGLSPDQPHHQGSQHKAGGKKAVVLLLEVEVVVVESGNCLLHLVGIAQELLPMQLLQVGH